MTGRRTLPEVKTAASKYAGSGRVNDGSGEYTGSDGEHCMVGQICADLKMRVPEYGDHENTFTVEYCALMQQQLTAPAVKWLTNVQETADGLEHVGGCPPPPWGAVIDQWLPR